MRLGRRSGASSNVTDNDKSMRMPDRFRYLRDSASFAEGNPWEWAITSAFRAIVDGCESAVPKAPADDTDHAQALGYWSALHRLLIYRLGWSRPGCGLRRWYDAGHPTDDETLAFVSRVWLADGLLDDYLAWLTGQPLVFSGPDWGSGREYFQHSQEELSPEWRRWLEVHEASPASHAEKRGDSLHLSGHPGQVGPRDPSATLAVVNERERTAGFMTGAIDGWYYGALEQIGALPDRAPNSWHVEVVVKPVGHLGEFRLSRETGLLFSGRHRTHMWGN